MDSKLFLEVFQREEGMTGIKTLLILAVAALDLTIVPRRVGADQLVADISLGIACMPCPVLYSCS